MVEDDLYQRASLSYPEALDLPTLRASGPNSLLQSPRSEVRLCRYYGECVLCEG